MITDWKTAIDIIYYFCTMVWRCKIMKHHEWTCKASEGIAPTTEELNSGLEGFKAYSKMYCKTCGKLSDLNHE